MYLYVIKFNCGNQKSVAQPIRLKDPLRIDLNRIEKVKKILLNKA